MMDLKLTVDDVPSLTVDKLKTALKEFDQPTTGKKAELAARLLECLRGAASTQIEITPAEGPAAEIVEKEIVTTEETKSSTDTTAIAVSADADTTISIQSTPAEIAVKASSVVDDDPEKQTATSAVELLPSLPTTESKSVSLDMEASINNDTVAGSATNATAVVVTAATASAPSTSIGDAAHGSKKINKDLLREKLLREQAMASLRNKTQSQSQSQSQSTRKTASATSTTSVSAIGKSAGTPATTVSVPVPVPVPVSVSVVEGPSVNLRINHLQRPLTIPALRAFLEKLATTSAGPAVVPTIAPEHQNSDGSVDASIEANAAGADVVVGAGVGEDAGSAAIAEQDLWVSAIKTHCYVTFPSLATAVACYTQIQGQGQGQGHQRFPVSSSMDLSAFYTSLTAAELNAAAMAGSELPPEALLKPTDWERLVVQKTSPKSAAPAVTTTTASGNASSTTAATVAAPSAPVSFVTKRHLNEFGASAGPGTVVLDGSTSSKRRRDQDQDKDSGSSSNNRNSSHINSNNCNSNKHARLEELKPPAAPPAPAAPAATPLCGPDLHFRKTKAGPSIYWLPVSADIQENRWAAARARTGAGTGTGAGVHTHVHASTKTEIRN